MQPRELTEQLGVQAHGGVVYGVWVRSHRCWGQGLSHSGPGSHMLRPQLGLILFPSIILYSDRQPGGQDGECQVGLREAEMRIN